MSDVGRSYCVEALWPSEGGGGEGRPEKKKKREGEGGGGGEGDGRERVFGLTAGFVSFFQFSVLTLFALDVDRRRELVSRASRS